MRRLVVLGVLVGVAVEVEAAVLVAGAVGAPLTALLLVGLSAAGWSLLRNRLGRGLRRMRADPPGSFPPAPFAGTTGTLYDVVAGVLLVVPGFVSAALGLLLLLPPVRWLTTRMLGRAVVRRLAGSAAVTRLGTTASPHPGGVRARRGPAGDARTVDGDVVRRRGES